MRPAEIEAWVLKIVDRVEAGERVEDSRVECKATWIDEAKAARRLAGHANAARGEEVLWVVGVDEDDGRVATPASVEVAEWWPRVQRHFDGVTPDLSWHGNVPTSSGVPVTALCFDTSRAPYVVTNLTGLGGIDREVPWREGTVIRSAYRRDLLRILVPTARLPEVEVVAFEASGRFKEPDSIQWQVSGALFVCPNVTPTVFPTHRERGVLRLMSVAGADRCAELPFEPFHPTSRKEGPIVVRDDAIVFREPGLLGILGSATLGPSADLNRPDLAIPEIGKVSIRLALAMVGSDMPLVVDVGLDRVAWDDPVAAKFRCSG